MIERFKTRRVEPFSRTDGCLRGRAYVTERRTVGSSFLESAKSSFSLERIPFSILLYHLLPAFARWRERLPHDTRKHRLRTPRNAEAELSIKAGQSLCMTTVNSIPPTDLATKL